MGLRADAAAVRQRPRVRAAGGRRMQRALRRDAPDDRRPRRQRHGQREYPQHSRAALPRRADVRRGRGYSGVRRRPLVDGAERRLAARQHPAHPVQHDGARQLGPPTADIYGPGRMVIIYTIAGVVGFIASSTAGAVLGWMPIPFLRGAQVTLGASASIFGLLGALVYYGRRGGSSMVHREAMGYAVSLFVMGLILPGVDNYAHAGGFAGGFLAAKWLDPLKSERMDHLVGAAVCLALTALAILASLLIAFWPLIMQMFGAPGAIVG